MLYCSFFLCSIGIEAQDLASQARRLFKTNVAIFSNALSFSPSIITDRYPGAFINFLVLHIWPFQPNPLLLYLFKLHFEKKFEFRKYIPPRQVRTLLFR